MARPTASNINETGVNKEYPVAGQDNDSQGFRDNFTIISDNFVRLKLNPRPMDNTARLEIKNLRNYTKCNQLTSLVIFPMNCKQLKYNYSMVDKYSLGAFVT